LPQIMSASRMRVGLLSMCATDKLVKPNAGGELRQKRQRFGRQLHCFVSRCIERVRRRRDQR
jgi:hypothetical protein